jgi:superfamily I DNA and/or RNA helicase
MIWSFLIYFLGIQGPRCILAGDHLQLPPTIQSVEAEKKGMGKTLFERLTEAYGEEITSMLTVQYRMHEHIMSWSSKELYNNKVYPMLLCYQFRPGFDCFSVIFLFLLFPCFVSDQSTF